MVSIGDRQNAVAPLRVEVLSRSFRKSHDSMEEAAASEAANTSLRIGQSSHRARSITQEEERDRKGFLLILPWVKHLLWRFFGWLVSLRVLLPIAIVASIAVTVATVWGFTHNNTNTAINDLSERLRIQISNRISKDLYTLFTLPGVINKVQRGYSNLDQVDSQDLEVLRSIAFTHINIFLSVTHIYFGTTRGDMIGYERQDEDTLMLWKRSNETDDMMYILPVDTGTGKPVGEPLHVLPFNSVERPWYVAAKEAQGATWSEVYLFSDNVLGITASLPVYNAENELMLVTASDRTLVSIVQLLEEAVEEDIRAMLIERNGLLVGSSIENVTRNKERVNILESQDSYVLDAIQFLIEQEGNLDSLRIPSDQPLRYRFKGNSKGDRILLDVVEFNSGPSLQWLLLVVVPESMFTSTIHENNIFTLIITISTVLFASALGIVITLVITNPLKRLSVQMKKVSAMEFEEVFQRASILLEVRQIQKSFFKMMYALQSFRKFVPEAVIKQLLVNHSVADLALETHHVTVLFLDIVNFTSMSEQMQTEDLLSVISEAMEQLSLVITKHKGTVDKYIGDAIMALFNAPDRIDGHQEYACKVALECHERLAKLHKDWAERGLPKLNCRIGINSGRCLVGTFGSSNRLNYTAIGDSVNVAARLEPLNKMYGTDTLISETVYDAVKLRFCARAVDNVQLKGRQAQTMVFELCGERDVVNETTLELEQITVAALSAHRDGNTKAALEWLEQALTLPGYENDKALIMVQRRIQEQELCGTCEPLVLKEK